MILGWQETFLSNGEMREGRIANEQLEDEHLTEPEKQQIEMNATEQHTISSTSITAFPWSLDITSS